jgi:ApbE superfamily uncharacterized protein (UPF0280 family)
MTGAMIAPVARLLPDGQRLHLQHGPIDLVIGAEGERDRAFRAAARRFATILDELVTELPLLRSPAGQMPRGAVARRMAQAVLPHAARVFVTPMAAVAGAVAEEILHAMLAAAPLSRAHVNNGGDIALHLAPGTSVRLAIARPDGAALGLVQVAAGQGVGGIATSGRGGRSFSLGIADAVTVLAATAPQADVAATLIANAVDLPGHPAIARTPAHHLQPDSDLGPRLVTTGLGALTSAETARALERGLAAAAALREAGHIHAAALFLNGASRTLGPAGLTRPATPEPAHA